MIRKSKIAIIGTSTGQRELYKKARLHGYYVIGFSWGASDEMLALMDKFYNISIVEKDLIVQKCKEEGVCGVVSNGSDLTALITSYVAEKLNLIGTSYLNMCFIQNKLWVREQTCDIDGLSSVGYHLYEGNMPQEYPLVIKPVRGGGKIGLSYVPDKESFAKAIDYTMKNDCQVLIEEYIEGQEISVESISFHGHHEVIQLTDKENTGAPHFVETAHHQPSQLPTSIQNKIRKIVPMLLDKIGFTDGATHVEMKIKDDNIYLIEVNPRGGGGEISNRLTELSTGYDYVFSMIDIAVGKYVPVKVENRHYSGIYFLCLQTKSRLEFFQNLNDQDWLVEKKYDGETPLTEATGNHNRNGYFIYKSSHKILIGKD